MAWSGPRASTSLPHTPEGPQPRDAVRQTGSCRADLMTASGQVSCPLPGRLVGVSGQYAGGDGRRGPLCQPSSPWELSRAVRAADDGSWLPEGSWHHDLRHHFVLVRIASGLGQGRVEAASARERHDDAEHLRHMWPNADESTRAAVAVVLTARADSDPAVLAVLAVLAVQLRAFKANRPHRCRSEACQTKCRNTSRTTLAWMTAVEYQWHRALTCTDTRSDHWVAMSVCGCAEYILSTFATGSGRHHTQIGQSPARLAHLPPITPGEQTCQTTRRRLTAPGVWSAVVRTLADVTTSPSGVVVWRATLAV